MIFPEYQSSELVADHLSPLFTAVIGRYSAPVPIKPPSSSCYFHTKRKFHPAVPEAVYGGVEPVCTFFFLISYFFFSLISYFLSFFLFLCWSRPHLWNCSRHH